MRLEGKVALVTGGASGIGAATCRRLAAEGARVAVTDLNLEPAKEVAGEVDGEAFELDVRSTGSIASAVGAAEQELGPLDVLVNNAGYDEFGWFGQTEEAMWDRVLAVNLRGVLAVTHAVLGGMQQRGGGRIVNLASEAGRAGSAGSAVYSAAKATYGTSSAWEAWSSGSKSALADASSSSQEARVSSAFEGYLSDVQPMLTSLPILAANQGSQTASAVNVVSDAQTESLSVFSGMYGDSRSTDSALSRPLDAE